ncbi:MAG: TrkA family potassium uptake protein [Lachnospiraceae bacterium]|jgi:trk system potassium uptake protein TrkA|uniref:potassium channel family protein n=1 Tax=Clostridium sp. (strain SY8519) TaxID=1042156 RepID=UPI0002172229|nr:TrkA family potassium uptake protein [Clostridium sp. SY8519]MCI1655845.1 TrkA family potassium uptake protein [Lachnospiraceae bacterium]MCI1658001.1 TrkA family potassium uptake protein [Lachnospiraceae bacterium]MCI2196381.1 TrkA family potassium uptake protein [Lachnospiraceae bacterium]BAK48579.1 K+ transport system [Clostridium sp. SY8519]
MKSVLVIGIGIFGEYAVKKLSALGHQVMAIDQKEERLKAIQAYALDVLIGDGTSEELIQSLGVRNFDFCLVSVGQNFEASLMTTFLLKDNGAQVVVSKAYNEIHRKFLLRNGADYVVFPEKQMAEWTASRFSADHILDYIALTDEYALVEVQVPVEWSGKSIGALNVRRKHHVNILAVKRNGVLDPEIMATTVLEEGEVLMVLGSTKAIQKCFRT